MAAYWKCILLLTLQLSSGIFSKEILCEKEAYPPSKSDELPNFTLNLDLPASERWTELIQLKSKELQSLVLYVQSLMEDLLGKSIYSLLYNNIHKITESLPNPYQEEIRAIAKTVKLPVEYITVYNIFYEMFVLCTSVIIEDSNGNIYHGRNLDNGALLGWDSHNKTWMVTERLKPLSATLHWKKNGKVIFQSVTFIGYVGILTAMKANKFSFSLDKRMALNNGIVGILEWVIFHDHNQQWISLLSREVLEHAESYEEAKAILSKRRLIAPVYYILGGTNASEGVIITRYRDNMDLLPLHSRSKSWFLIQTNYDHWNKPPFFDDRRTPAEVCLKESTQKKASFNQLFNIFSTKPILNKSTVYTTLMSAKSGQMHSWLRYCPEPCYPW